MTALAARRQAKITALYDQLTVNNRSYRNGEISRDEWVATNRLLNEQGRPLGIELPPAGLS